MMNLVGSQRHTMKVRERWNPWTCPVCGDECSDPSDCQDSVCHNGHMVRLRTNREGGFNVEIEKNS